MRFGLRITLTALLAGWLVPLAASADHHVLKAPPGHRWAKPGPENDIIAILIGLQQGKVGGVRSHEPDPTGSPVPYVGKGTLRYRCACHITDEEGPCSVVIDDLDRRATCTGSCGDLKPCRWKAGPGPEEPEDQIPFGRGHESGPGSCGPRVKPTEPSSPFKVAPLRQRGMQKVAPMPTAPAVPEPTVPTGAATRKAPTKPGFIWVDDHWERPRAK